MKAEKERELEYDKMMNPGMYGVQRKWVPGDTYMSVRKVESDQI